MKNKKVVIYSLIGLGCIALMFLVHWAFVIGALIIIWLNKKELNIN
tara:strand:+ start:366 stop:503 length:138 start_codon:yes stop_codon:yes gene_type:complete